ncbi:MAG: hypothetical protein IT374_05645 [Polyangiaceae bacterium]|nr:hypothetical protein [Polyangiaceae bacterium]
MTSTARLGYPDDTGMDLSSLDAIGGPRVVAAVVVVAVILAVVPRLLRKPPPSPFERRRCACGWEGGVSPYKPRCSRCGAPI